ncbi:hypothetical protein ACIQOW_13555 [Kitasatospora sp. NPDC091335]|uniref:hypothetical protein n=1 Tax=Kitasatospora sp. NPDC091335 TaxID=3364085 RepID=UPI003809C80F
MVIEHPSGCYSAPVYPLVPRNQSDGYALVYDGRNCTGHVIAVVPPGEQTTQEFGSSVFVK